MVPKSIRDEVGLDEGVRVAAFVDDLGRVILETPEAVKARIRRRAGQGHDVSGSAVDQLREERERDTFLLDSDLLDSDLLDSDLLDTDLLDTEPGSSQ